MRTPIAAIAAAALVAASMPAIAETVAAAQGALAAPDQTYLEKLAQGNLAEVAAGSLAQQKARSEEVRDFGEHMIRDHGQMLAETQTMAEQKDLTLPEQPDAEHEAAMDKLEATAPDQFDREFMTQMVKDHEKTLQLVQDAAANADDASLKAMATNAEPKIREHLELARQTLESLSDGAGEAQ